jgi:cellulose synthase/poly-beta-1,6-N-acetylglucosamine synthase-like glycosyltransferase
MLLLFGGALAVLLAYTGLLGWGWRRGRRPAPPAASGEPPPISVVVAARNESATLPVLLDALDRQTHPDAEVVIVDDASTDDTAPIAEAWAQDRPAARVVRVTDPAPPRKKRALTRGIAAARHDLLAVTDADCRPPPEWLSVLAATHAGADEDLVLAGYSPLRGTGLLGAFARYEALVEALYTAAAIGLGRPYMAVSRNLSYPRSVFDAVGGFGGRDAPSPMSGDDDLFVQAVYRHGCATVRALHDPRTFVPSDAPTSWSAWRRQRRRHVSAGRHYPWTVGLHLTLLPTSLTLLWLAPLILGTTGVGLLATGLLARHAALGPAAAALEETDLLALFPLWELGYVLYHVTIVPLGLWSPPDRW